MRMMTVAGAFAATALLAVESVAFSPRVAMAGALEQQQYFKCQSGYTFQVSGSAARCRKGGTIETIAPTCVPGSTLQQNVEGQKDRCRFANGSYVNYVCPPLFPYDVKPGEDKCTKKGPDSIIAPAVPTTL